MSNDRLERFADCVFNEQRRWSVIPMLRVAQALVVVLILLASANRSVAVTSIDPGIFDVRSAGHWDDAGKAGT
jgi:hypothetical protein